MAFRDDGFERLFRAEYSSVLSAVRWTVRDGAVAEELTQEAFTRALQRWRRVSRHPNPAAWVRLTALRLAVRSDTRRRAGDLLVPAWTVASVDEPHDLDLLRAIDDLSEQQRLAVVLHHLADLAVDEVADVMNVSNGTVKTHLSRGRANLESALADTEVEVDDVTR